MEEWEEVVSSHGRSHVDTVGNGTFELSDASEADPLDEEEVGDEEGRGEEDNVDDNPEVVVGLPATAGAQGDPNQETLAGHTASHSQVRVAEGAASHSTAAITQRTLQPPLSNSVSDGRRGGGSSPQGEQVNDSSAQPRIDVHTPSRFAAEAGGGWPECCT